VSDRRLGSLEANERTLVATPGFGPVSLGLRNKAMAVVGQHRAGPVSVPSFERVEQPADSA